MIESPPAKRPRNAIKTKARILSAAQKAFVNQGYSQASIRDIAREAEVAPSLLMRHFGSKPMLFREALLHGIHSASYADTVFRHGYDGFGERMARVAVDEAEVDMTAMVILATGDPDARQVTSEVAQESIVNGLATWLGPPNAYARALAIVMMLNGFMLFTKQLSMGDVPDHVVQWLARALQDIVDEGEGRPGYRPETESCDAETGTGQADD